ncbi:MAG: hypothetical protein GY758_17355 [Fuerstiella sp.]|nr:hypothetical protein [Fuerstiella sp.]
MTFGLLSTTGVLAGVLALAAGLWLAQRLRVQHQEVEVLSTLFWRAAIEETRARVLTRRFRHWPAWLLLVVIASVLWMLVARPESVPLDGTQHVVLVDWSVEDPEVRAQDLDIAVQRATTLPSSAREIMAVGDHLETLLTAGEPIEHASLRAAGNISSSPQGLHWAIESLSSRATKEQPLAVHIVGHAVIEQEYLDALSSKVSVFRIEREIPSRIRLRTLGVSDSSDGQWQTVDVAVVFDAINRIEPSTILVTIDDEPVTQALQQTDTVRFLLPDVVASGGTLKVKIDGDEIGSMTLPVRTPILVSFAADVPQTLRDLVMLDGACRIVESDADVHVGVTGDAELQLSAQDQPAFLIESNHEDPNNALLELIDELALKQIDATSIAAQSGQLVDLTVISSDQRRIAVWESLFTNSFDFQESRSCPIFVARAVRWLADRPPVIPWAEQGQRLPAAAPEFDRSTRTSALTSDGREILVTRLTRPVVRAAMIPLTPAAGIFRKFSLYTWLGLAATALLVVEWGLFQRGRMP